MANPVISSAPKAAPVSAAAAQRAAWGLVATATLWGLTFPLTKMGVQAVSPEFMVFGRFFLATVLLVPFVPRTAWGSQTLRYGLLLGGLNAALHVLQAHSLLHISASRCAFLLGSNVLFVPILEQWSGLRRIGWMDALATLVCLAGLFVLTGADVGDVGGGDVMALLAALCFALYVIVVTFAGKHGLDYRSLTLCQLATTTVLTAVLAFDSFPPLADMDGAVYVIILACGVGCTLVPVLLQCKFQPFLRAHTAALIVSLEPLFAAVLACAMLDEPMTHAVLVGGGLMLLAAALPQLPGRLLTTHI